MEPKDGRREGREKQAGRKNHKKIGRKQERKRNRKEEKQGKEKICFFNLKGSEVEAALFPQFGATGSVAPFTVTMKMFS